MKCVSAAVTACSLRGGIGKYEYRCNDCGHTGWSACDDIKSRWAQRHHEEARAQRQINPPMIMPGSVTFDDGIRGGSKQHVEIMQTLLKTNSILAEMPFKESNVNYTQLHDRVDLEPTVIRAMKKVCPLVFPEYTDMVSAREDVKQAQARLDRATATWKALGATPKKVKEKRKGERRQLGSRERRS